LLRKIISTNTTDYWIGFCQRLDIPATPIYALEQLPEHPHLKAVNLFQKVSHPSEGDIVQVRPTLKFSQSPASVQRPAPRLGEHSLELLLELGFSEHEVQSMMARRVAVQSPDKA
jgi:formyl-CoA transferase